MLKLKNIKRKGNIATADVYYGHGYTEHFSIEVNVKTGEIIRHTLDIDEESRMPGQAAYTLYVLADEYGMRLPKEMTYATH